MNKEHASQSNAGSAEQPGPSALFAVARERQGNASSAEKPGTSPQCDPHMTIISLAHIFAQRSEETRVKKLLSDVATLRAWQTEEHASHKIRDAMTKLGSEWNVPQKAAGKKRPPSEIAADLEREILAFAERLWHKKSPFFINGKCCKAFAGEYATRDNQASTQGLRHIYSSLDRFVL